MGILTSAGSAARMLGPVYVTNIYHNFGPRYTFASIGGLVLLTFFITLCTQACAPVCVRGRVLTDVGADKFKLLIPHVSWRGNGM
jgi:hypothetical protein